MSKIKSQKVARISKRNSKSSSFSQSEKGTLFAKGKKRFSKKMKGVFEKKKLSSLSTMTNINFWGLIDYPVTTEKAVRLVEDENKLTFQIRKLETTKQDIKKTFEEEFKVKTEKLNTLIDRKGKKRVVIKLKKEFSAGDIGVKLGII